jgi:hypothetical protein
VRLGEALVAKTILDGVIEVRALRVSGQEALDDRTGHQKRCPHSGRHIDRDESISREQVVLAALIDDSKVAVRSASLSGRTG